jgi:hypothetical protein
MVVAGVVFGNAMHDIRIQLPVIERRIKHILKDIDKITNGI